MREELIIEFAFGFGFGMISGVLLTIIVYILVGGHIWI
jgi:hypothetical protein